MPNVGRKGKGSHTQSVLFATKYWTKASSKKWLQDHNKKGKKYYTDGYDGPDKDGKYHRWRQVDPEDNKFRYRNQIIEKKGKEPSIILVQGFPKGSKPKDMDAWFMACANEFGVVAEIMEDEQDNKQTEEDMTLTVKIQTLEKRIVELTQQIEAAVSKIAVLENTIAEKGKEITDLTQAHETEITTMRAEAAEKEKRTMAAHETAVAKIEDLEKGATELQGAKDKLAKAEAALKNPAFVDAALMGMKAGDAPDGDADAADTDPNATAAPTIYQQYLALANEPAAQTAFWNKNEEAIRADMKQIAAEEEKNAPAETE